MDLNGTFALVQRGGVATTDALAAAGLSRSAISRAARRGDLVRLARGLYAAGPEVDPLYALARFGTLSHTTAAHVHGFALLDPPGRHVTAQNRRRSVPADVRLHRNLLAAGDELEHSGLPVTSPLRTALDCAATLPEPAAVVLLDHVLHHHAVGVGALSRAAAELRGPRVAAVRRRVALADGRAESPLESLARLVFQRAGLSPELQVVVRDGGVFVARVDFLFRAERLVVETDGFEHHGDRAHFRRDRERLNALVALGFQVLRFTWDDVVHHPDAMVATIRRAMQAS